MASKETLFLVIFGWALCILAWLVCAPLMTYFFIKLYQQRGEIMIYKRFPITTLTTYIVVMIDITIQKPFFILFQVGPVITATQVLLFISVTLFPLSYYGFAYAILWKFYLLFYEINYSKESMNDGWKNIINPDSGTKSFFLEHHDTYGNYQWFTKRLVITAISCTVFSYIWWILGCIHWYYIDIEDGVGYGDYKYIRIATGIDLLLISIPLLSMVYMYFKIPAFYDYFSVRAELKLTFIIIVIYYIGIIFVQLEVVWLKLFGTYTINSRWYSMVHTTVTIICQCAVMLIQTSWTLQKLEPYLHIRWNRTRSQIQMKDMVIKASAHNDDIDQQTALNTRKNSEHQENVDEKTEMDSSSMVANVNEITLHDILSSTQTFDAFMLHIVKEFSVEILLSYVEFTQLLQYLFTHYDDMISKDVHDEEVNGTLIDLPQSVPDSYIINTATKSELNEQLSKSRTEDLVQNADPEHLKPKQTENDVLLLVLFIGSSLYNKYVKKNADLEINISFTLRKKFVKMFTGHNNQDQDVELDLNDVIQLFVDGNKAMYKLLGYSLSRFKTKKDYERLLESSRSGAKPSLNLRRDSKNFRRRSTDI